jgi:ubiquinone/menaquinone biosynthesis C-methylase UbiE
MAETKIVFDAADDYERFMGIWSRAIGARFLAWVGAPRNARWLDVGCGTGAFSELIMRHAAPASLTGIDPSQDQIDYVRKRLPGQTSMSGFGRSSEADEGGGLSRGVRGRDAHY